MIKDKGLNVSSSSLLLFVDETGHERLVDPGYPIFGLGGCGILANLYENILVSPWKQIKIDYFGDPNKQLHASELKPSQDLTLIKAIAKYFRTQQFFRFAATMKISTTIPNNWEPYQIVAFSLVKRIEEVLRHCNPDGIHFFLEDSERANKFANEYLVSFSCFTALGKEIVLHRHFMKKAAQNPGLEVADFVVNAAGRQAYSRLKGKDDLNKDFQCVFSEVPKELISFMEIDSADLE